MREHVWSTRGEPKPLFVTAPYKRSDRFLHVSCYLLFDT